MSTASELGLTYQVTFWIGFGGNPKVVWCDSRTQAGQVMADLVGHCERIEFSVVQRMKLAPPSAGKEEGSIE